MAEQKTIADVVYPPVDIADMREAVTHCNQPGDAAKLCKALKEARKVIKAMGEHWARETLPIIDAALSAPSRNCDRLNVDDAFSAFSFMCDNTDCKDCPYKKNNKFGDRELCAMLFLYDNGNGGKEGGAK